MPAVRFEILRCDSTTAARAGVLETAHGKVPTPAFAPVGTQGAVKALAPRDLHSLGVALVMMNACHLAMRPGVATVAALGGLHAFAGWDGAIMTDSGGYQAFSLGDAVRRDADGLMLRDPASGALHRFTPESLVAIQETLAVDIALPLDVCTPYPTTPQQAALDVDTTMRWAERTQAARRRSEPAFYGIVQGGIDLELRAQAARAIARLGFDGFALGGLSVGEPKAAMLRVVAATVSHLPEERPRHLLGVGHPEDLVLCIGEGVDTFDCVMPTRVARNGGALTMNGRLNLRNAVYASDRRPLAEGCSCYACQRFSRGALRHLLLAREILALQLLTLHNVHFTVELVNRAREAILAGQFARFRDQFLAEYRGGELASLPAGGRHSS